MAQVFDNGMVAHLWANASQASARSHNGNFSFEGRTIYSYSTPIAKIIEGVTGNVVLRTSHTFSVTTSGKHEPAITHATDYGRTMPEFRVPSIGAWGGRTRDGAYTVDHDRNVAFLLNAYEECKGKAKRARDLYRPVIELLSRPANTLSNYCAAFGLDVPVFDLAADSAEIEAYRKAREEKRGTPQAIAKRLKEMQARERRRIEKERIEALDEFERQTEMRARWLDGGSIWGGTLRTENNGALLRVKGENLETSMNATVPLAHAIKAFRFVKLLRQSGEAWQRNGKTVRVGHFQVDRIEANGDIKAGCHFIEWTEIERIARKIGVFNDSASSEIVESSAAH